jgi:hypothetical protein
MVTPTRKESHVVDLKIMDNNECLNDEQYFNSSKALRSSRQIGIVETPRAKKAMESEPKPLPGLHELPTGISGLIQNS